MKNIIWFCLVVTLAATIAASCSKKTARDTRPADNPPPAVEQNEEVYLKEGFIADDLFRIVIVESRNAGESIESPQEKAEKRALATLQKYLLDRNKIYDNNTRAELLNLIQNDGRFSRQDIVHKDNNVYYLEIRKRNIQRFIDSTAQSR